MGAAGVKGVDGKRELIGTLSVSCLGWRWGAGDPWGNGVMCNLPHPTDTLVSSHRPRISATSPSPTSRCCCCPSTRCGCVDVWNQQCFLNGPGHRPIYLTCKSLAMGNGWVTQLLSAPRIVLGMRLGINVWTLDDIVTLSLLSCAVPRRGVRPGPQH